MNYELRTTRSFERAFKKLPETVQEYVKEQVFSLETNPLLGKPLKPPFRPLRSLHLKLNNIQYRVIYRIHDAAQVIDLYYVASRENFYAEIRRLQLKEAA